MTDTGDRPYMHSGLTDRVLGTTAFLGGTHDFCEFGNQTADLKDKLVNGRLKLYHKNAGQVVASGAVDNNPYFDSYVQSNYTIIIEAVLDENLEDDNKYPERCLSTINICVDQKETGFRLKDNEKYYITKTETMGTIAEGKTKDQNNPEILMSEFLSKVRHDDLGDDITEAADRNLYKFQEISFKILSVDDCLEICPNKDRTLGDFENQIIKLKDIPKNKTTECPGKPISEKNAFYAHYNYERKKEYPIVVEISASRYCEIEVEKVPDTYICELDRASKPTDFGSDSTTWRSAEYKYVGTTDLSDVDNSGCLFYFCEPTTKKYHGPLSLAPQCLADLTDRKMIFDYPANWAYVRDT